MTIEEFYRRGDICVQTRNLCINEQIKTFKDIELHFYRCGTFRNLRNCGERSNNELMAVYNKYKDIYAEKKITKPVSIIKSEPKLEDVVTDLSEVIKITHTANVYLERIESKLEDYWRNQGCEETTEGDVAEPYVDATSGTTYTADLESIEDKLLNYWRERETTETTIATDLDDIEDKLQDYWREKKAPLSGDAEYSEKTIAGVTDIVDLEGVEKTIKDYWRELASEGLGSSIDTVDTKKPEQSE